MAANKIEPVELVRLVHAAPTRVCAVVTGGGVLSLAWLFGEPGASRTFLDAQIPYSMRALDEYVVSTLSSTFHRLRQAEWRQRRS